MQNPVHQEKPKQTKNISNIPKYRWKDEFSFLLKINFVKNIDVN